MYSSSEIDCIIAVMLKILDGKCKMVTEEKVIMEALYFQEKHNQGFKLGGDIHDLISKACLMRAEGGITEEMRNIIYEHRLFAETMISRPVMKAFKAGLRLNGVLPKREADL